MPYVASVGLSALPSAAQVAFAIKAMHTAYRLVKKYQQKSKASNRRSRNRKGDPRKQKGGWSK